MKTDTDSDDSAEIDSDSGEIEEPEPVPKVKKGKQKIAQETDVKEPVQKQHKRNVDSSHKSDEKTSEEKSDDNSKVIHKTLWKTSKQTDSVETVKPFAQEQCLCLYKDKDRSHYMDYNLIQMS